MQQKRLVVIERGEVELWLPEADGERFVGLIGPTKVGMARREGNLWGEAIWGKPWNRGFPGTGIFIPLNHGFCLSICEDFQF